MLTLPHNLLPGNGIHKAEKISVKIGIAHFPDQIWGRVPTRNQPALGVQVMEVMLKTRERAEELHSGRTNAKTLMIPAVELRTKPETIQHVDRMVSLKEEFPNDFPK